LKLQQSWATKARETFMQKAERQVATAVKQGLKVEFHVTRDDVGNALQELFKASEHTRGITVKGPND
jgi:hypothetical protein